jgi:paraquat-inducible protein B
MSKKSNPTLIGAFVIGATILMVAAVALFGGAEYFAKRQHYVAYFEEQTKGLRVGSNVLLNGVRIGYVSEIALLMDETNFDTRTRVTMEILPENLIVTDLGRVVGTGERDTVSHDRIVTEAGLRAQLETESLVTGQLVLQLVLKPETEAVMRGVDAPYPEIPTIPSDVQALVQQVQDWFKKTSAEIDVGEMAQRLNRILEGIEQLAHSQEIREMLAGANQLVNAETTQQMSSKIAATLDELRNTASEFGILADNLDGRIDSLSTQLKPAAEQFAALLTDTEAMLVAAGEQLRGESVQMYQLESTLSELEAAARAMRQFFDYLERNPEALLSGKHR